MTKGENIDIKELDESISELSTSLGDFKRKTFAFMEKIERGLYGEDKNESPGLIKRMTSLERRVGNLEGTGGTKTTQEAAYIKAAKIAYQTVSTSLILYLIFKGLIDPIDLKTPL